MKKYCATVTGLGEEAMRLVENDLCIIFNENAPPELAELSVLHTIEELKEEVKAGDTIKLGGNTYSILQVGSEANHTLRTLGHCTMWLYNESKKNQNCLPGYIVVDVQGVRPVFEVGQTIEIDG